MYSYVICDHMRALDVYMSALNGSCPLMGIPCSNYEDFLKGRCMDCDIFRGKCPVIGNNTWVTTCSTQTAAAPFYLLLVSNYPVSYCEKLWVHILGVSFVSTIKTFLSSRLIWHWVISYINSPAAYCAASLFLQDLLLSVVLPFYCKTLVPTIQSINYKVNLKYL